VWISADAIIFWSFDAPDTGTLSVGSRPGYSLQG
jgi:hypothetical protein